MSLAETTKNENPRDAMLIAIGYASEGLKLQGFTEDAAEFERIVNCFVDLNRQLLTAAEKIIEGYTASKGEVYGEDIRRLEAVIEKAKCEV